MLFGWDAGQNDRHIDANQEQTKNDHYRKPGAKVALNQRLSASNQFNGVKLSHSKSCSPST